MIPAILKPIAICRFRKNARPELINPPMSVTFIPDAAITWKTPVVFRLSEKSFGICSFIPKIIPINRLEDGDGSVLENKEINFCRTLFICFKLVSNKPELLFTDSILGKYIDKIVFLLFSKRNLRTPEIRTKSP